MDELVHRLRADKLPSYSPDGGITSRIDFGEILSERHEAAAVIEAQEALIERLQWNAIGLRKKA